MIQLANKQTTEQELKIKLTDEQYRAYIDRLATTQIETQKLNRWERKQAESLKRAYLDGGHIEGFTARVEKQGVSAKIGAIAI